MKQLGGWVGLLAIVFAVVRCGGGGGEPPVAQPPPPAPPPVMYAYVSNSADDTVSAFSIDAATGALKQIGSPTATEIGHPDAFEVTPTGIAVDRAKRFLYVANLNGASLFGYAINASTGALTLLPDVPFIFGRGPFLFAVHPAGKFLYVPNFASNDVTAFEIVYETAPERNPGELEAIDDNVTSFATGEIGPPPAAPASVAITPSGLFAYVTNTQQNTISAFSIDNTGALTTIGAPIAAGNTPFSARIDPSGRFLYVTNSGAQNLSGYSIDAVTGALAAMPGSPFPTLGVPSDVAIHPAGTFVYVTTSSNIVQTFAVSQTTGALTAVAGPAAITGSFPRGAAFDPSGKFLYVANQLGDNVSAYSVNAATGALTPIVGSPFAAGNGAFWIATVQVSP